MLLSHVKDRQIKQIPDADGAKQLAAEMQASGCDALGVEVEKSKGKSLKFLEHFSFLKHLCVGGHARDLDTIAALTELRELCFLRVTVPDFGFLAGLPKLRVFDMRFGGCKSFETLAVATNLFGLSFLRLPTLKNLDFVSSMPGLQCLEVDSCKGVIGLPNFSSNPALRKIVLETMNGLTSLEGVETAQGLEQFVVMESKVLPPREFERVVRCPSIQKILTGVGFTTSARYREAIACVPDRLRMGGYYGTEFAKFSFRGYSQPAEPGAAADGGA